MEQTWLDLAFLHWRVPVDAVRRKIPASLSVDSFDGAAWLAVVPFRMDGVRLRWLPPLPGTYAFPELNLRTYVSADGKPGVWFFSLDADNALAVAVARRWFGLPYFSAEMEVRPEGEGFRFGSRRRGDGVPAEFRARYGLSGPEFRARPGSLEHFLTERYCLYAVSRGRIVRGEIHHQPWPLRPGRAEIEANTMAAAAGFELPREAPLVHFASRIRAFVWPPREAR
jgi:hypothetical protein